MGSELLYIDLQSMNVLHKPRNFRKDFSQSASTVDISADSCESPTLSMDDSDSCELLASDLQYFDLSPNTKKSKNILPKRSLLPDSECLGNDCTSKFCNQHYYSSNSFLWNSMINNINYDKGCWSDSNWHNNDWNCVGSDLTTNSGTVNSLNDEKNSDIFHNCFSSTNPSSNFLASKSLSSDPSKNESTAEATPETMVTNGCQSVNFTSLNGYQFPPLLKSFKSANSFLNNHPPLSTNFTCEKPDKAFNDKENGGRFRKDLSFDKDVDLNSITQSNGPPVTMKVYTSWSCDSENTTYVKKSEKVQLVARSGNWIYVRVNSSPNRYGWIPEFTLLESEMLSRKMTN